MYILSNIISSVRVRSKVQVKKTSVLLARGVLLLTVLFVLIGCPDTSNNGSSGSSPSIPRNLRHRVRNETVFLSWDDASNATSYNIYRATGDGPSNVLFDGRWEGTTTLYTDRDFAEARGDLRGTEYTYTVRAVNAFGMSDPSNAVITIPRPIIPGLPTVFSAVGGNGEVTLTWNDPPEVPGLVAVEYSIIRGYSVKFYNTDYIQDIIPNVVGNTYIDTGLPNRKYTYILRGVSATGEVTDRSISANINVTDESSVTPTNFTALSVAETEVTLVWDGHSSSTEYRLHRDGEPVVTNPSPLTATTYTDTGLEPGTTYNYTVQGVKDGSTSRAVLLSATTSASVAPVMVTGLITNAGDTRVALDWDRTADANTYNVYRDGDTTAIATGLTINSYIDTGLTNGTQYSYTVSATNSTSEGPQSDAVIATPAVSGSTEDNLLITILSLEQLNNIRYNLAGTSYKTSASDTGVRCGASGNVDCKGYELGRSLDFQDPASYENTYSHPRGVNPDWIPNAHHAFATNPGWDPIGNRHGAFTAFLNGNGHTISNLYSRALDTDDFEDNVGLFGRIADPATIIDIGILDARLYGGNDWQPSSSYSNTRSATGVGTLNATGALVGWQQSGRIINSYAKGTIAVGSSSYPLPAIGRSSVHDAIGGLVGHQSHPSVIYASYVIGAELRAGSANTDFVGGLVGVQADRVIASYTDNLGLSGVRASPYNSITINRPRVTANTDRGSHIGGIAGFVSRRIVNGDTTGFWRGVSYTVYISSATGILASYTTRSSLHGGRPRILSGSSADFTADADSYAGRSIRGFTAETVGDTWNSAADLTLGAWSFDGALPALMYADYDGPGNVFACSTDSSPPADAIIINKCGELLPGQNM